MAKQSLSVVEENGLRASGDGEDGVERLVALGRALSDPIRVRMLGMMAEGRGCCDLPDCGVPAADQDAGICVCEFERHFGMGQSKVSYHMKKLKDAGLIREEKRGRWSFYSLDRAATGGLVGETARYLGASPVQTADV